MLQLEFFGRFHTLDVDEKSISFSILDQFLISNKFLPHSTIATDCVCMKNQQGDTSRFLRVLSADNIK